MLRTGGIRCFGAHERSLVVSGDRVPSAQSHSSTHRRDTLFGSVLQIPSLPGPSTAREPVMVVVHSEAADDARDSDGAVHAGDDTLSLASKEDAALDANEAARTMGLEKMPISLMYFELDW
jgi:hypothetical protein